MPSTRRGFLATALAVSAGCVNQTPRSTSATDTSRRSPEPSSGTPPAPPRQRWQYDTGHQRLASVTLAPNPDGPTVYTGSAPPRQTDTNTATGADEHSLQAVSFPTGEKVWRADMPASVPIPPRYGRHANRDRLYVSTGYQSVHGREWELHALDPTSGETAWGFDTENRRFVYPLATNDSHVFVGQRDDQVGPTGESLYALTAADGTTDWRVESGDAYKSRNAVRRGILFVTVRGQLRALSPRDGTERWRVTTDDVLSGPAFGSRGKRVFIGHDGVVRALGRDDGSEVWRRSFDFTISRVATPREGMSSTVYVGDYDGRLLALSPLDGTTRWTYSFDQSQAYPTVQRTSERLFVGGPGVHALDPVSGKRHWKFTPDVEGDIRVEASTTVFASARNRLWAIDPPSGTVRWRYTPDAPIVGPAAAGDQAVIGVGETLYALDGSAQP